MDLQMNNIQSMPIDKVVPYDKNPRLNDDAVEPTAKSIKEFGWQQPIVVDKDNVVIAGHTRLKAAKKLKLKTVPVVVADKLSDEQVKAYRLADNKVGELADWDDGILDGELDDIMNIDMEDFGFDLSEPEVEEEKFEDLIVPDTYALNVVVKNEQEQASLYDELNERGFEVKVVNL